MIPATASAKVGQAFTVRADIRPFVIGGKQTILAKRVPKSKGNRPGFILMLNGSAIEFKTFADGDEKWITAKTKRGTIKVGEFYKLLVFRSGNQASIYVNGIDRTDPKFNKAAVGDVNCDVDAFIGFQVYDVVREQQPMRDGGKIYMIGVYNDIWISAAKPETFEKNPLVIPVSKLPELKQRFAGRRSYG
jgi:hypothetical protein